MAKLAGEQLRSVRSQRLSEFATMVDDGRRVLFVENFGQFVLWCSSA